MFIKTKYTCKDEQRDPHGYQELETKKLFLQILYYTLFYIIYYTSYFSEVREVG